MLRLLVPIDGSKVSLRAIGLVVRLYGQFRQKPEVHVLTVQTSWPEASGRALSRKQLEAYHREEGEKDLAKALKRLATAGIACERHIGVGDPVLVIAHFARAKKADLVVMGTHGRGEVADAVLGSVAHGTVHQCGAPVLLVK